MLPGLPRPTTNFEALQLLENYVPLVFATLLEPFFILLSRLLCLLQPFHELRRGHAPASITIETQYGALPPQFNTFRALRSRHFLLAALCGISLLTNVLSVSLGATFNEFSTSLNIPTLVTPLRSTALTRDSFLPFAKLSIYFFEPYYVQLANISTNTSLPPWMDTKFAYLPFSNGAEGVNSDGAAFRSRTRGFGVSPNCAPLSTSSAADISAQFALVRGERREQPFVVNIKARNGSTVQCDPLQGFLDIDAARGPSALELYSQLGPRAFIDNSTNARVLIPDGGLCRQFLIGGWMRIDPVDAAASLNMTLIQCRPQLQTAMFEVIVDAKGYVLGSQMIGEFDDVTRFMNATLAADLAQQSTGLMVSGAAIGGWHNDTFSEDWPTYLLTLKMGSNRLIDPARNPPGHNEMLPLFDDLQRRLGASVLGLTTSMFESTPNAEPMPGTIIAQEIRIFMNFPAFVISVVTLALAVIVSTLLYTKEKQPYLPRLPSAIGSLIAYVAASSAVGEYGSRSGQGTYSFGSFVGVDGKPHVGIEKDPFVVPLNASYLRRTKSSMTFRWHSRRRRASKKAGAGAGALHVEP